MKSFQEVGVALDVLLDKTGDLIQVISAEADILYANRRWLDALNYNPEDVEGVDFKYVFLHPICHHPFEDFMRGLHRGKSFPHVELTLIAQNGLLVFIEGSLIPRIENGALHTVVGIFRNVTAHRDAETELERLFMLSVDMLGITSFDGYFLKVNPAWERSLGYTDAELIGQKFIDFVHPDDREQTLQAAEVANREPLNLPFENRYRTRDGGYRWLSWNSAPYPEEKQVYFVARDITERKQVELSLFQAKHQLQGILHNSGTLIAMKDLERRYMLVNPAFEQLVGRSASEIIGRTDEDLFEPEDVAQIAANERVMLLAGEAQPFEEKLAGSDGDHFYLMTRFPLFDPSGQVYALCLIGSDITYRKLTEVQLALRNQAIEYSPTAISIADATLPDLPLIYINPAFERNTGYSALEVIGRNCRFLQADDRDQEGIAIIREALQEEQACKVVLRNYRKDGTLFYNELSLAPIHDKDHRLTHYVGISTDVTERVYADERIQSQNEALLIANRALVRAQQQAEDATRLKTQFLATMSHELRTPLNAIIGYTEIQLAGMAGDLKDEQRDYQRRVLANAEHLLELINDVLDISKIEAGRLELLHKPFNVALWVEEIVAQTKGLADEKALAFEVHLDDRMPAVIVGDSARIKQIVINLLSNAFKFTPQGSVRLQVRRHGPDAWRLIVSDTGKGIPSHLQETVFEEFRQVDSTSQREQGGTGLGLSIVRKLTLMMGGNVRLQSEIGKGTTFIVTLPLVEEPSIQSRTHA